MMSLVSAVNASPTCAVPVIVGTPVAGLFAGRLRYTVRVVTEDQSRLPAQA